RPYERLSFLQQSSRGYSSERSEDGGDRREKIYVKQRTHVKYRMILIKQLKKQWLLHLIMCSGLFSGIFAFFSGIFAFFWCLAFFLVLLGFSGISYIFWCFGLF